MMSSGSLVLMSPSSSGTSSFIFWILRSVMRILGLVNSHVCSSWFCTKYGEMYPRSISIPSVKSISSTSVWPSSTIVAPLAPTRLKHVAIVRPIASDPVAIVATFSMSLSSVTGLAIALISAASSFDAFCSPRWRPIGLAPEATSLRPSRTSACVSTVDVVVPSPAFWSVFDATSTSSFAPTFALASSSSMSRAMVTPSLTTSGTP
mmetsp:Transcript_61786/g.163794  ORF Transcript_61786/g.163794 Transcript_61786/m.163794 type:complete len:206 (+) Transcript_61786:1252-1869(+)